MSCGDQPRQKTLPNDRGDRTSVLRCKLVSYLQGEGVVGVGRPKVLSDDDREWLVRWVRRPSSELLRRFQTWN